MDIYSRARKRQKPNLCLRLHSDDPREITRASQASELIGTSQWENRTCFLSFRALDNCTLQLRCHTAAKHFEILSPQMSFLSCSPQWTENEDSSANHEIFFSKTTSFNRNSFLRIGLLPHKHERIKSDMIQVAMQEIEGQTTLRYGTFSKLLNRSGIFSTVPGDMAIVRQSLEWAFTVGLIYENGVLGAVCGFYSRHRTPWTCSCIPNVFSAIAIADWLKTKEVFLNKLMGTEDIFKGKPVVLPATTTRTFTQKAEETLVTWPAWICQFKKFVKTNLFRKWIRIHPKRWSKVKSKEAT